MKKMRIAFMILLLSILTGCGGEAENQAAEKAAFAEGTQKGSIILEDGEAIYACGFYKILKIDKESNEMQILWEAKPVDGRRVFEKGEAVLIGDRICFVGMVEPEKDMTALCVIRTDGSSFEQVEELPERIYDCSMFFQDGMLEFFAVYIGQEDVVRHYRVYEDGCLEKDTEALDHMPEGCERIGCYDGYLSDVESLDLYGAYFYEKTEFVSGEGYVDSLVRVEPESGVQTEFCLGDLRVCAWNEKGFLSECWSSENSLHTLYLTDVGTMETQTLVKFSTYAKVLDMDEEYIYWMRERSGNEEGSYDVRGISLKNGVTKSLFGTDSVRIWESASCPDVLMPITFQNGFVYYADVRDYKLYLMRRSLSEPEKEQFMGAAFFDTGIASVGKIESRYEEVTDETLPGVVLLEIDSERLVVDERFAGAERINQYLEEWQEENIADKGLPKSLLQNEEAWSEEETEDYYCVPYSYSCVVSPVFYMDDHYFSFYQSEDAYWGGAHGVLFRTGFTFDLRTGEKMELTDIIGNSEAEFREIVSAYFAEYINKNPDAFWENAVEIVRSWSDFEIGYYLTPEGIRFWLPEYVISSFAAGCQEVTVPYEEFDMKIWFNTQKEIIGKSGAVSKEPVQTYWEVGTKEYDVVLKDLVPGQSLELVIRRDDGREQTAQVFRRDEDYEEPTEFWAEAFENLLGHNGFCLYDQYMGMWYTQKYYAFENEDLICLADSWGWEPGKDYMVDLDGDGDRELICNVTYIADGAQCTVIYCYDGQQVLYSGGDDLLDEDYDGFGVGCVGSEYLPEENVIRIWFWKDELEDFDERKYEIDMETLEWWHFS